MTSAEALWRRSERSSGWERSMCATSRPILRPRLAAVVLAAVRPKAAGGVLGPRRKSWITSAERDIGSDAAPFGSRMKSPAVKKVPTKIDARMFHFGFSCRLTARSAQLVPMG